MSDKFANNKFSVMAGGKEIVCDILFRFHSDETGKDYMAFTDHSKAPDGSASVFYATYDPNAENIDLAPLQTEHEWFMVREIFQGMQEDAAKTMMQQLRDTFNGEGGEEAPAEEKAE